MVIETDFKGYINSMASRYLNSLYSKASTLLLIIIYLLSYIHTFQFNTRNKNDGASSFSKNKFQMQLNVNRKANMNENSVWKVNLKLQKQGYKDIDTALKVRFIPDRNYEPPQGRIFIEDDYQGIINMYIYIYIFNLHYIYMHI